MSRRSSLNMLLVTCLHSRPCIILFGLSTTRSLHLETYRMITRVAKQAALAWKTGPHTGSSSSLQYLPRSPYGTIST